MELFEDLSFFLYVGELCRKYIQVGVNLSAAYVANELAIYL